MINLESEAKVPRFWLLELSAMCVELERRLESDHLNADHARQLSAAVIAAISPTSYEDRAVIMHARYTFGLLLGSPPIPGEPRHPDSWPAGVAPLELVPR